MFFITSDIKFLCLVRGMTLSQNLAGKSGKFSAINNPLTTLAEKNTTKQFGKLVHDFAKKFFYFYNNGWASVWGSQRRHSNATNIVKIEQ